MTTTTTTYTRPDGTPYSDADAAVIERTREAYLTGRAFRNVAASHRSRYGYKPPITRSTWAHCVTTLGRMASSSDALAQVAAAIVGRVNLYGTAAEEAAKVYEAAAQALASGYDDVIGRSGPEAGRRSSHHREFTLRERLLVDIWLSEATAPMDSGVPSLGWCLAALARAEGVQVDARRFPSLVKR